jgi:hypothetical protein
MTRVEGRSPLKAWGQGLSKRLGQRRPKSQSRRDLNSSHANVGFCRKAEVGRGQLAGLLQQVDFRLPERELHVLTHRERYVSRASRAFSEMLNAAPRAKRRK